MAGIRRTLGRLRRRLASRLVASRDRYRPDFRDTTLDASLRALARAGKPDTGPGDPVTRHFRARQKPRWFVQPDEVAALVRRVEQERGEWRDRTLERVRADAQSLAIYARPGPPLHEHFPWKSIELGPGEDRLYPVRPHRFAFLPRLALATHYDSDLAARLHGILQSWMTYAASRDNELAFCSNLVVIQRLLACSWAWAFLAGHASSDQLESLHAAERALLAIIRADTAFLLPRLGDSVPNNHLLADRFASWFIASVWPEFDTRRESAGEEALSWVDELSRQILDDGTSIEHSTHYHALACEMATAFVLLQRRNGRKTPAWVLERLHAMLHFQLELRAGNTAPIAIGDGVEDPMIPLNVGDEDMAQSYTAIARSLGEAPLPDEPYVDAGGEWAWWMLAGEFDTTESNRPRGSGLRQYPLGGFHVLAEQTPGTKLIFRTAPAPESEAIAGHMHADLLGVYVYLHGVPCIVDAGTYSYRTRANTPTRAGLHNPRHYLIGPRAHNGPLIDNADPLGTPTRDFRPWSTSVRAQRTLSEDGDGLSWIESELTGPPPYAGHRRGVVHVHGRFWLIYDVPIPPRQGLRTAFQFPQSARIERCSEQVIRARIGCVTLHLVSSCSTRDVAVVEGSDAGGWISPSYGDLLAAPQVRFTCPADSAAPVAFLIADSEVAGAQCTTLEVKSSKNGLAFRLVHENGTEFVLIRTGRGPVSAWGHRSDARLRWTRMINGTEAEARSMCRSDA